MKIIAFIEARQDDVIRKILEHCGLWHDPPARAPPVAAAISRPVRPPPLPLPESASGIRYEADPEFLEHTRREQSEQLELPW